MGMKKTHRGRPRLIVELEDILKAVRHHRQVVGAARQLGCSPAYIHVRLKESGVTLGELLEHPEPLGAHIDKTEMSGRGSRR